MQRMDPAPRSAAVVKAMPVRLENYRGGHEQPTGCGSNEGREGEGVMPHQGRRKCGVFRLFRRAWLRLQIAGSRKGAGFSRERSPFADEMWTPWNGGHDERPPGTWILWLLLIVGTICGIIGR